MKTHKRRKSFGFDDDESEEVNISLHYNIYDEYNVRTMEGMLPTEDMTLVSSTATSLKKLQNYAGEDAYRTIFKWGDIEYIGLLKKVDYEYSTFSRYGQPLKAEATVCLSIDSLGKHIDTYDPISPFEKLSLASSEVKAYTKGEEAYVRTEVGLQGAMR